MADNTLNDNNSTLNSKSTIVFPSSGSLFMHKMPTPKNLHSKPLSKEGLLFKLLGAQGKIRSGGDDIVW